MQIFIDTANLDEIKAAMAWGVIDGVTTNPSLIKREVERLKAAGQAVDMDGHVRAILRAAGAENPVSLEVTATDAAGMAQQGKLLFQKYNGVMGNVVIKIPVNTYMGNGFEGLKAIKALEDAEIPVNCTLVFTPEQALLAAKAGATYVSPFAGRVDDHIRSQAGIAFEKGDYFPVEGWAAEDEEGGEDTLDDEGIVSGVDLVAKIAELFEKHEVDSNIIASSIRNPRQAREVALAGADIATIPFSVLKGMMLHPKTKEGVEKFTADAVPEYQELIGRQAPQPVLERAAPQQPSPQPQQRPQPTAYDLANKRQ
ncbi:transaldolase [Candidatus Woesearchaeota archaeon]|nr:transaldolase [Candidatus Woesearchaeota archaeon]